MTLITLEEHYAWDPASTGNVVATWLSTHNPLGHQRLYDRGPLRLEQMDAAGIDFQLLSLFDPGVQDEHDVTRAVELARLANDDLAETVRARPNRFGGFATLATQDPDAAAAELERAVIELGLVGALINGHCQGRYLDDPAYQPLFACAEALSAPIYLPPTTPNPPSWTPGSHPPSTTACISRRGVSPPRRARTCCDSSTPACSTRSQGCS